MLDKSYKDTWITRSKRLNGLTYAEYLSGPEWEYVRSEVSKRPWSKNCRFCLATTNLEIHHRSYNFVHTDHPLRNLICVCRSCHQAIHDLSKDEKVSVRVATIKYCKKYLKNQEYNLDRAKWGYDPIKFLNSLKNNPHNSLASA